MRILLNFYLSGASFDSCITMANFMMQDVSIESEYRNYSRGTQQSLQAWSGEIIDIALVRHFFLF